MSSLNPLDIQQRHFHITCPVGFDYDFMLDFLSPRIIEGVECVTQGKYVRSFRFEKPTVGDIKHYMNGYFEVEYQATKNTLAVKVVCDDEYGFDEVQQRVRFMFDLDTNMQVIDQQLQSDPVLQRGFVDNRVPRMPKAFDSFEFCIRAILGQQVSVKAATTLAKRIAHSTQLTTPESFPAGIDFFFPQCDDLLNHSFDSLGLTSSRISTLQVVIRALKNDTISLDKAQVFEDFLEQWIALKGVGPWTANYLAMRGLGIQDSFPDKDLGVLKALATENKYPARKAVLQQAKAWQPYRAYATLCLWNGLGH
ncbi:AlkA N-terminal domain-containing protein [Vibrio algivorus]|uniref:DNA-3-methyladenine glycosylase II n=1 Tax=Vibrio algivorus TaxID=1667024 RepID=A0A557NUX2_9VIBR|nr:AlkA N-terminal domain-containing protein [Vibrio algivorus]TVO32192.1 DNA-3-methyladenine glycosylase 2 family protein [Vibrio algivorus]